MTPEGRRPTPSSIARSARNADCQLLIAAVACIQPENCRRACYTRRFNMPSRYAQWMYDWEHRLTSVDNNRVVRPLEWGVEWARDWPCRNGYRPGQAPENPEKFFLDYNRRIVGGERRVLFLHAADGLPTGDARGAGFLHARSSRSETRG